MNRFTNTLAQTILEKKWEDCSLHELQNLTQKYPYASALQWLYSQKLADQKHEDYTLQLQKTSLYHHQPLLAQYIMNAQPAVQAQPNTGLEKEHSPTPAPQHEATPPQPTDTATNITEQPPGENPVPEFTLKPANANQPPLLFTPYHTIDYFAAQGIKLNEDPKNEGRFETQLKSFTQWLKQMKRLPGATAQSISINEEKNIEQLAQRSINDASIATEAMAEVWVKQGNTSQAIDIYKKLCLQIPHKSAYFAAKIDFLKKQV